MDKVKLIIAVELRQTLRDKVFSRLMMLTVVMMTLAAWNTHRLITHKKGEVQVQQALVVDNDQNLIAQIDSLNAGLADYADSYTLPTNGVRLTYNNHRLTHLPFSPMALLAIGQSDLYSNYKKVVLYFNESYEMSSQELISPVEQLFGQLDLAFVWTYLLPLIIVLVSFNILSIERETGRLPLIASQPLSLAKWLLIKISVRFLIIMAVVMLATALLLVIFGGGLFTQLGDLTKLGLILFLYCGFWFLLSFVTNLAGFSSGKSLILLTSSWVLFVFLIPSVINQLSNEMHPIPSRLEAVNHHQRMYNEMESNLQAEMVSLYKTHPDWASDDPVTKDMSSSTGWNIDFLAKQYIAQLKHQPESRNYEARIDNRNQWLGRVRLLSPAMIMQQALTSLAGTSTNHYRSFLRQSQQYAEVYRQQVFKGLFTNHAFTSREIEDLPVFEFDQDKVPVTIWADLGILLVYMGLLIVLALISSRRALSIK